MKVGDLVRAHNKAQTIGVVMYVEAASQRCPRIQVFTEGEMCWWWKHNATIVSGVVNESR